MKKGGGAAPSAIFSCFTAENDWLPGIFSSSAALIWSIDVSVASRQGTVTKNVHQ